MRISDWSSDVCSSDLLSVEFGIGAEAEIDRMPRPDVLAVPVGTVAHSRDRGLGRAEQARHLCVRQLGMVAYQPGDAVGLVLTLGDRGVARTLGAGGGARHGQAGAEVGRGAGWERE